MTRIRIVDDDHQLLRALSSTEPNLGYRFQPDRVGYAAQRGCA